MDVPLHGSLPAQLLVEGLGALEGFPIIKGFIMILYLKTVPVGRRDKVLLQTRCTFLECV